MAKSATKSQAAKSDAKKQPSKKLAAAAVQTTPVVNNAITARKTGKKWMIT